jgi:DNA-binding transcriptional MerR regulator
MSDSVYIPPALCRELLDVCVFRKHVELQANDEIARQVSEEVERQIKEFLPVSLEQQVQEARAHLDKLKTALQNSYGLEPVS